MEYSLALNTQGLAFGGQLASSGDLKSLSLPWRVSTVSFPNRCGCLAAQLKSEIKASLQSAQTSPIHVGDDLRRDSSNNKPETNNKVRLLVGLPLDVVSESQTLNHSRAIAAGLRALKLMGVEGVEVPIWWGIVEDKEMGKYDWSGYLAIAEMVRDAGLKLHVTLSFHSSSSPKISLPSWVSKLGQSQPDIYFKDRSGKHFKGCLSLAVDELPVLNSKSPSEVYRDFCESFKSTFKSFMGSTVTGITIGLGPDGDLKYPSHHKPQKEGKIIGTGEFQCYDSHMLDRLKKQAEAAGNPLWGLGGPHDAPTYDAYPTSTNFFQNQSGSWESPYGTFFLSWYANELISHADRLLSMAASVFNEIPVPVYGNIPLTHSWYDTRSHASELTAGYFNTDGRDGYDKVAEVFAKNKCKMVIGGWDLVDGEQPAGSQARPERLLGQIRSACDRHGVGVGGRNALISGQGLESIKGNISGGSAEVFVYERMGAEFFSPEHFPAFTKFVRSLSQPELHSDDLPEAKEVSVSSKVNPQMQVA